MALPRVYVETTIPSFYHEERTEPDVVARRNWTRRWWNVAPRRYELLTSEPVIDELIGAIPARSALRVSLLRNIPLLDVAEEIGIIVQEYVRHKLMPADPSGDALHLAMASFHRCDFLITWNCRHLANANKFGHIRRVNEGLGLFVPTLVTPLELLGVGYDEPSS